MVWWVDGKAAGSGKPSVARSIIEETMRAKGGKLSAEDEREIASALGALYAGEPLSLLSPISPPPSPRSLLLSSPLTCSCPWIVGAADIIVFVHASGD